VGVKTMGEGKRRGEQRKEKENSSKQRLKKMKLKLRRKRKVENKLSERIIHAEGKEEVEGRV
jgi:hypothetical protein